MLKCHTAHSPLIEPDMKISLIRLLQRLSSQAMRRPPTGFLLQVHQTHAVEVLVVAYSFGWPKGPLASTSHVLRKTLTYVGIDLSKTLARITVAKVVRPSLEMCVELLDELRQRHEAALLADHLTQPLPFSSPSLLRDGHVEVTLLASLSIAIIAKRVSQEIKLLSFSLKVHYPRLVPIDLQPHPLFELGLNPPLKLLSLITRLLPGRPKHVLPIDPVIQRVKPKLRLRLGLLTKLMSQKRKFPCALAFGLRRDKLQLFRNGIFIQAAFPLSSISISLLRPLRSTVVTRFFATMGLSDSRQGPTKSYLFLLAVLAPAGLPGSFADLCTRAAPFHPEEPNDCSCPLLHRRFQASSSLADWPLLFSVTRPKTGSLALRLACSPCKASPAELLPLTLARLLVERATYKISSFQNIRSARLILALQRRKGRQGKRKLDKTRDLN